MTNEQMKATSKGEFTASQAGETDQTMRIDSTEHLESYQLAPPPQETSGDEKPICTQR
jgi:hypothetical protein